MSTRYCIVVIGASRGGLDALSSILAGLPAAYGLPVAAVLHRHASAGGELCAMLQRHSALPVLEADDKLAVEPGRVVLAPADYHLLLDGGAFALSTEAPVRHARPSIDVLLESAARQYGRGAVGVVLTGGNDDGARGLAEIKARGGLALVQEPGTAEDRTMPEAAIEAAEVDQILPLDDITRALAGLASTYARKKQREIEKT